MDLFVDVYFKILFTSMFIFCVSLFLISDFFDLVMDCFGLDRYLEMWHMCLGIIIGLSGIPIIIHVPVLFVKIISMIWTM